MGVPAILGPWALGGWLWTPLCGLLRATHPHPQRAGWLCPRGAVARSRPHRPGGEGRRGPISAAATEPTAGWPVLGAGEGPTCPGDGVTAAKWEPPTVTTEGPKQTEFRGPGREKAQVQGWRAHAGLPAPGAPLPGGPGAGYRGQQRGCGGRRTRPAGEIVAVGTHLDPRGPASPELWLEPRGAGRELPQASSGKGGAGMGREAAAGGAGRTGRPRSGQRGPVQGEDVGSSLWVGGLGLEAARAGAGGLSAPREPAGFPLRPRVCLSVCDRPHLTGLSESDSTPGSFFRP